MYSYYIQVWQVCIIADAQAIGGAYFGPGGGAVVYGYVFCSGSEASLFDCGLATFPYCFHDNDVGVRCSTQGMLVLMA